MVIPALKGVKGDSIFAVYHSRENLPERVKCLITFITEVVGEAAKIG